MIILSFNIRSFQDIYDTSAESMYNFDEFEKYLTNYCPLLFSDSLSKQDIDKDETLKKEKLECVRNHQLTVCLPAFDNPYLDYDDENKVTGLKLPYIKYLHKLGWDAEYGTTFAENNNPQVSIILKPRDSVYTYE